MARVSHALRRHWLWLAANLVAAYPLLRLLWDIAADNLSPNPIQDFTQATGQAAILCLIGSLAVTPIQFSTGYNPIVRIRKSLGLWAFAYAVMHLYVFVGLDYEFSWKYIVQDGLAQKPYILFGLAALLILTPLAITSTRGWMGRLGRNWKRLHRWVYAAAVFAALHYLWVSKIDIGGKSLLYSVILALLLIVRLPVVRSRLVALRQRIRGKPQSPQSRTRGGRSKEPVAAQPMLSD
jgi:methionine sulfoxide reductase heme-binding subunit